MSAPQLIARWRAIPGWLRWTSALVLANAAFWKLRIVDTAHDTTVTVGPLDLYTEHYPMTRYGFEVLASGQLPLWNPYQLMGLPSLAIPHVGLFYPGNLIYLFVETALATELSLILHLALAGLGMWLLVRRLELGPLPAIAAAMTFMWSGWMIAYSREPSLLSGMSWLPITVYLIEQTLRGERRAWLGFVLAVACQLLNGATEFFVQTMYVCGLFTGLRLFQIARAEGRQGTGPAAAGSSALLVLAGLGLGVLLSLPQLLPSLELVGESTRGVDRLSIQEARDYGRILPFGFARQVLLLQGYATVGILPCAGLLLWHSGRRRPLYAFALILVAVSALLVFGGEVYRLYFEWTPFGDLFRRPHKFLHVHAFGQALMAALAIDWLGSRIHEPRRALWRRPAWWTCAAGLLTACLWLAMQEAVSPWLLALIALLGAFGAVTSPRSRRAAVVGLLVLQAAGLAAGVGETFVRPAGQPERFVRNEALLQRLGRAAGDQRVHIEPSIYFLPGLMQKQGMLQRLHVLGDYAPLISRRAHAYFAEVGQRPSRNPFTGAIKLDASSRWPLIDLTATRFFVARAGGPLDAYLDGDAATRARPDIAAGEPGVRVYERGGALPRAYFVRGAIAAAGREQALALVARPDFDPRRQVVIEGEGEATSARGRPAAGSARVRIVSDEPEHIEIEVRSTEPGYLVLSDVHYPGWRASIDGEPAPILRANALFRAVQVETGTSTLTFRYASVPLRKGLLLAGLAAAGAALLYRELGRRGLATKADAS